jgi:H+/Cl- antiporter ClcA
LLLGKPTAYLVTGVPALNPLSLLQVAIAGALFAVVAILFCEVLHFASRLYKKYLPKPILRVAAGGALVIALTLMAGTYDYNGAGTGVIAAAIGGNAHPEAFALKILFTALTLGAGYKGGDVTPVLFTGATFGCVIGPLLGLDPSFSAALGMTAVFCGVTNCPIASTLLSLELFGGGGLPLFALCCAVSYMLSGYGGLYSEQEILFSKLRPEVRTKEEEL